jgi:hypothetical protein
MASIPLAEPLYRSTAFAAALRQELIARSRAYAEKHRLPYCESYGRSQVVCFPPADDGSHGNFLPQSYRAINADERWRTRLQKPHTSARTAFPRGEYGWRELDSCVSSDALLMNIFCFPRVLTRSRMLSLLSLAPGADPEFGVKARVPLKNGRFDRTEVDMRLGHLLVEAKLTEADFQRKDFAVLESYQDFENVFDRTSLPGAGNTCLGYQLIRNVLAAYANQCAFCVMLDARRPDLREAWYSVMRAVTDHELRVRCQVRTWQELAAALPDKLRSFLEEKYGVSPATF